MPSAVIVLVFITGCLLASIHITRDNDKKHLHKMLVREVEKTNLTFNITE